MVTLMRIFLEFLRLGCTSFGGPAAHIGFFQRRFVHELRWVPEEDFASTLALCQFLPGPSSSQLGFAIGYKRAGLGGALAAFSGFTLPSALLMLMAGLGATWLHSPGPWSAVLYMLQLTAVVVVADAVINMYQRYCQGPALRWLCSIGFIAFLVLPAQLPLLVVAALLGALFVSPSSPTRSVAAARPKLGWLTAAGVIAVWAAWQSQAATLGVGHAIAGFAQAGMWVFGGGHVVLPILQHQFPALDSNQFLAGYGLAQALPGPLFSFAAYLGTQVFDNPVLGACIALIAIFAPGFCLLLGVLDHWQTLVQKPRLGGAIAAVNAAVVALLAAALWHPLISHCIVVPFQLLLAVVGLWLLRVRRWPVLGLLTLAVVIGLLQGFEFG